MGARPPAPRSRGRGTRASSALRALRGRAVDLAPGCVEGLDEAREKARDRYKAAREGRDPEAKPAEGSTFRDAFARHVRAMKTNRRQPRSISDAEYDARHYCGTLEYVAVRATISCEGAGDPLGLLDTARGGTRPGELHADLVPATYRLQVELRDPWGAAPERALSAEVRIEAGATSTIRVPVGAASR